MSVETNYDERQLSNDGANGAEPYRAAISVVGVAPLLFHRWSCEDVASKAAAAKGSSEKKKDNIEAYLYRDANGEIAIPTEYLRQSLIAAAKFRQDPRSPRKSACDLFKAGVVAITDLASTGIKKPDYVDQRRVRVQHAGITRLRPALNAGWHVDLLLQILLAEYIVPSTLHEVLSAAGRLVGIGDFRPSYGRFQITAFKILTD